MAVLPAHIPSPSAGRRAPRTVPDPRLRAVHHPRRRRRRRRRRAALRARAAGRTGAIADVATWAVPFGLVGARLYHLATNPELYWGGPDGPGTIGALEDLGRRPRHLGRRRCSARSAPGSPAGATGSSFAVVADSLAPGAAARPGDRPVGQLVQPGAVRPADRPAVGAAHRRGPPRSPGLPRSSRYYQPTFLYESIWDVGVALVVVLVDRRLALHPRPRLRALRDALHDRPGLDRGAADRRRAPVLRPAAQRLDRARSCSSRRSAYFVRRAAADDA